MVEPLKPPGRKDPLKRTPVGHVPPVPRSRATLALSARAAEGRFALQICTECSHVTYPPRDRCPKCWGELEWRDQTTGAAVLAETTIRVTTDLYFRDHLPWRIGTVALDAGPVALAHLNGDVKVADRVTMRLMLDRAGNAALLAMPEKGCENMTDDGQFREFTTFPKFRRILVTDGRGKIGQAVARALVKSGAETVYLGDAEPLLRFDGEEEMQGLSKVQMVPLDVTDSRSVAELAAQLGGRTDILVNTASFVRSGGVAFGSNLRDQRKAIEVNVLGLSRLAQAFGPAMSARSADGLNSAGAFVDILSIHALAGWAQFAGLAASAAARLSLQQSLRAEMRTSGIRVMSVFIGPVDDEWHQTVPLPKLAPAQIAEAVVAALENGREEICVGDVATDIMRKWLRDPKLLAREINA